MNPSLLAPLLNKSHRMLCSGETSVMSTGAGGWGCVQLWGPTWSCWVQSRQRECSKGCRTSEADIWDRLLGSCGCPNPGSAQGQAGRLGAKRSLRPLPTQLHLPSCRPRSATRGRPQPSSRQRGAASGLRSTQGRGCGRGGAGWSEDRRERDSGGWERGVW